MAPVTMGQGRGIGLTPIKAAGRGAPAGRRARLVGGHGWPAGTAGRRARLVGGHGWSAGTAGRRARLVAGALADPAALPVCPPAEDHVAQATARILQKGDETGRLETLRAQFPDRGPVEQVAGLDTASQIVGRSVSGQARR